MINSSPSYLTQRRDRFQSTINRFQSVGSPSVCSPYLNQEDECRLNMVLKHNSQLLNENAQLSEMVLNLKQLTQSLQQQSQSLLQQRDKYTGEYTSVAAQCQHYRTLYEALNKDITLQSSSLKATFSVERDKLMGQVQRLHHELQQRDIDWREESRKMVDAYERKQCQQMALVKRDYEDSKELMEMQIRQLKQASEHSKYEQEHSMGIVGGRLEESKAEVVAVRREMEHRDKLHQLQVEEMKRNEKSVVREQVREVESRKEIEIRQLNSKIMQLKKCMVEKEKNNLQHSSAFQQESEQLYCEMDGIKRQKEEMSEEMQRVVGQLQEKQEKQRNRMQEIGEMEMANIYALHQSELELVTGQRDKLNQICEEKSEEMRRVYKEIQYVRECHQGQSMRSERLVRELRERIYSLEQESLQSVELLKIKMGELHQGDIRALEQYYSEELVGHVQRSRLLEENLGKERERVYELLFENDQGRKGAELEIGRLKAKIQDMKVKYAAAKLEFKEEITSMGSKIQLTSQTLLRETEQKQKGAEFFEVEKKKYIGIIEGKDKEIAIMEESIRRIEDNYKTEIGQVKKQLEGVKEGVVRKEKEFRESKRGLEESFLKKSEEMMKQIKSSRELLEEEPKQLIELREKILEVEKEIFKKNKENEFLIRENKFLQQEVGLKSGFIETIQLESSAAIQDEKSKIKVMMGKNQIAMKDYYQQLLNSKGEDNAQLKLMLAEKEKQVRLLIEKYTQLEKNLKELIAANGKLREMEEKIVNLGLDQNLVKNMAELFKKRGVK